MFTVDELNNLAALVDVGGRALAGQKPLVEAAQVLSVAAQLTDKLRQLLQAAETKTPPDTESPATPAQD